MLIGDFHQTPVHAYRARIIEQYDDPGRYAPAFYRLCFCKCGRGVCYDEDDVPHEVGKGDMFWYTPNTPRKYRATSDRPWIISYINFSIGTKKDNLPELLGLGFRSRVIRLGEAATRRIDILMYNASVQYSEDTEAGNVIMHSILYEILCELSIALRGEAATGDVSYDFSSVLSYIRKNLKGDLSIDTLCAETGMSCLYIQLSYQRMRRI